jgi:hypothetical protein
MIESKVIQILDLENKTGTQELYKQKRLVYFFEVLQVLMKNQKYSLNFYIFSIFIFFLQMFVQFFSLPFQYNDFFSKVSNYLVVIILPDRYITNSSTYSNATTIIFIISGVYLSLILFVLIYGKKTKIVILIKALTMFNFILIHYLGVPIINVLMQSLNCKDGVHLYLNSTCYSSGSHIPYLLVSLFLLLIYLLMIWAITFYLNEIGAENAEIPSRINCNFELYMHFSKIFYFISCNLVRIYFPDSKALTILLHSLLIVLAVVILVYIYKKVYFYNPIYNVMYWNCWSMLLWSISITLIKTIANLSECFLIHLLGWIGIYLLVFYIESNMESELLNNLNPYDKSTIKSLVSFLEKILSYTTTSTYYSPSKRQTAITLITTFEEILNRDDDIRENHSKFFHDTHVQEKFKNKVDLVIFSFVNIIYDYYLNMKKGEGDLNEENIFLHSSHFLITVLNNNVYCAYLCTKVRANSHKNKFLQFLLCEYIKEVIIFNMNKVSSEESIQTIQIGTLLAYEYYLNLFFSKISEEVCKQCDFFAIFKKEMIMKGDRGNTQNFLSNFKSDSFYDLGKEIMNLKWQIEEAYNQILSIYPTRELKAHFNNYLNLVMDDEDKIRLEEKNFLEKQITFLREKGEIYKSLFSSGSCVIIVDGHSTIGALLYTTPNFSRLFKIEQNQAINLTIHDLVPTALEQFHHEVVINGIKYSNLTTIFSKQRILYVRGENGHLIMAQVFIRNIPELENGLNYIISIIKKEDSEHSSSMILDSNLIINGITNFGIFDLDQSNFSLSHIGYYIPNIFQQIKYNPVLGYHFDNKGPEYMGVFYKLEALTGRRRSTYEGTIEKILKKIAADGSLVKQADDEDLMVLTNLVSEACAKEYVTSYTASTRSFVNNKYKYHSLYLNKISINEDMIDESVNSISNKIKNKQTSQLHHQYNNGDSKLNSEFFLNLKNDSSHIASVFSGQSASSKSSTNVHMSLKERLYNINITKTRLQKQKGELTYIQTMKKFCLLFVFFSVTLSVVSERITENEFHVMNQFLIDNNFINKTKIYISCIYASVINLRFSNDSLYQDKLAIADKIVSYVDDIHYISESIYTFYSDLRDKMNVNMSIGLRTSEGTLPISTEDYIHLLSSMSLKTIKSSPNIDKTKEMNLISNLYTEDLVDLSFIFVNNTYIKGFNNTYIEEKFGFSNFFFENNLIFSVNIALIIIIICVFIYLSFSLLKWEKRLLNFAQKFKSPLFIKYLHTLLDLKKKYVHSEKEENENEEDDKKDEAIKKTDIETNKLKVKEKEIDKKKKKNQNKRNIKKKDVNYEKLQQTYKQSCLITILKVMTVLILSLFYYVITITLINSNIFTTLSFHQATHDLDGYFETNFKNFREMKYQVTQIRNGEHVEKFTEPDKTSLANLLFDVKSYFPTTEVLIIKLETIFSGDACSLLPEMINCKIFMNGILTRGIDPTLMQLNLQFSNFVAQANSGTIYMELLNSPNTFFMMYEEFMLTYLYELYNIYSDSTNQLKMMFIKSLLHNLFILLICFLALWIFSFFLLLFIIENMKDMFFSLVIFFLIVPSKHFLEDQELTDSFINLKKKI